MLYSKELMEHYENPQNVGSFPDDEPNVGTGVVGNPACGDVMKLQIKVDEEGTIIDSRFKTFGCGSAIASSSLLTERVKGKKVEEALGIKNADLAKELSLPPVKIHCSVMAEEALQAAIRNLREKAGQGPSDGETSKDKGDGSNSTAAQVKTVEGDAHGCPSCTRRK